MNLFAHFLKITNEAIKESVCLHQHPKTTANALLTARWRVWEQTHAWSHPWKFPGTVIFLLTRAFMTLLTISYREPDMCLFSFPSKRLSTSSLPRARKREVKKKQMLCVKESDGAKVFSIADKISLTVTRGQGAFPHPQRETDTHKSWVKKERRRKKKKKSYSLAHAESEVNVLVFGEEEDEEMIACLALLNRWIQADLKDRESKGQNTVRTIVCVWGWWAVSLSHTQTSKQTKKKTPRYHNTPFTNLPLTLRYHFPHKCTYHHNTNTTSSQFRLMNPYIQACFLFN